MVIYTGQNNTIGFYFIPKNNDKYKIPNFYSSKKVVHKFDSDGNFDIYSVKGTKDFYIYGITISNEKHITITDSNNDEINNIIIKDDNPGSSTIIVYGSVKNFENEYYLYLNDKKIKISILKSE